MPSGDTAADIVVVVMRALDERPRTADELSDALWERMRSPSATTPAISTLLDFLDRKGLTSHSRGGVYQLTAAGRQTLAHDPVPA